MASRTKYNGGFSVLIPVPAYGETCAILPFIEAALGMTKSERVVVMGASPKPSRYSFKAMQRLREHGHQPLPVNPAYGEILGTKCFRRIDEVPTPIDTVTVYLGKQRSDRLIDALTSSGARRIILNPGAENDELAQAARAKGIGIVEGCTLVMLSAGTF